MLKRVDHIGIAVNDLAAATAFYGATYGITNWEYIDLPERHMAVAVTTIGDTLLELITPTAPEAAFAAYLATHGEGVHHIAYEVDDIEGALRTLDGRGIRLVDAHGRPGIHHTCVAFLHPKATMGVLTELVQQTHDTEEGGADGH